VSIHDVIAILGEALAAIFGLVLILALLVARFAIKRNYKGKAEANPLVPPAPVACDHVVRPAGGESM
jgi:hypothetical protein